MNSGTGMVTLPAATLVKRRSPVELGIDIVAIFEQIQGWPDKVQSAYRAIADRLNDDPDPTLGRACEAVAALIDADSDTFDRLPYHNRQHYCEVVLTGYFLCLLCAKSATETQLVVLAALVHDLVHDGTSHTAFRLERASVERALPLLRAAGVSPATQGRIATLVMSTDPAQGWRFLAEVRQTHRDECTTPPTRQPLQVPLGAPELEALIPDSALARLACILCEADVLPSIGLTFEHSMGLQQRLSCEWQRPLDERDKLGFIEVALSSGLLGDFFLPNVLAARKNLVAMLHARAQS